MGFIERFRVECLRSILINTHLVEAAYRAGAHRYFYSSSACAYNTLVSKVEKIAGVKLKRAYQLDAPQGVAGRNSDNTFIKQVLRWEPDTTLDQGLAATYRWIEEQYQARKKGKRVVE